jgi:hypothetical protein
MTAELVPPPPATAEQQASWVVALARIDELIENFVALLPPERREPERLAMRTEQRRNLLASMEHELEVNGWLMPAWMRETAALTEEVR